MSQQGAVSPVIIALGANVGDPRAQMEAAVGQLRTVMEVEAISPLYRTAPVGYADQPDFLNAVLIGSTRQTVFALHRAMQRIEVEAGRARRIANGPRPIDLDLLAFGDLKWSSASLSVPHPRLQERAFVLVPLADVAPDWRHPTLGLSARELRDRLDDSSGIDRLEESPSW